VRRCQERGEADHRSKCEQSKRRMENERNEFLGFVNTMDLLTEAFGIRRSKGCSHLLTPNELLTTL